MIKANNIVSLLGRLGGDPETKTFDNGNSVCNFSLATSEKYTSKQGEKIEKTQWHNISAYGKTGEILQKFLEKGSQVQILGSLTYRKWEDKHGQKRTSCEIIAESFSFVGGGKESQGAKEYTPPEDKETSAPAPAKKTDENLPF